MADQIYLTLDASTQKAVEREQDLMASNGTSSMSVSLRGSNSSLNSMPGGVISTCFVRLVFGFSVSFLISTTYLATPSCWFYGKNIFRGLGCKLKRN